MREKIGGRWVGDRFSRRRYQLGNASLSSRLLHGYRVYLNQPQLTALPPDKSADGGKLIDCTEWIHKSIFASRFAYRSSRFGWILFKRAAAIARVVNEVQYDFFFSFFDIYKNRKDIRLSS